MTSARSVTLSPRTISLSSEYSIGQKNAAAKLTTSTLLFRAIAELTEGGATRQRVGRAS